jgi:hypothetical protein
MKLHTQAVEDGALGILLACHGRIRSFSEMAVRLAEARGVSDEAVSTTAAALHRYFTVAFPLHAEDEEVRLAGALEGLPLNAEATALMQRLGGEHHALDALLARLIPLWAGLAENPQRAGLVQPQLAEPSHAFRQQVLAHADEEERALYPEIARVLSGEALREMAVAMRARRSGASLGHIA